MREITFRGMNKETGEWEYGYYGKLENLDREIHYIIKPTVTFMQTTSVYFTDVEVEKKTVGQSTGLKDNNGVDVFEGDEVHILPTFNGSDIYAEVYWKETGFALRRKNELDSSVGYFEMVSSHIEVIGNIYEGERP